jgi:adenosylhomocysteine nucleosidase
LAFDRVGIVVGLTAEARIARTLPGRVAIGGGTAAGATAAAERLLAGGATGLISFGLAGGLDPALPPGALLVPHTVLANGDRYPTDAALSQWLGGPTPHVMLGASEVVADVTDKQRLWQTLGAAAVDLESASVARVASTHRLPFAVLRAICDPAQRSLPPAALSALDAKGAVGVWRVLASIALQPCQLPDLLRLAGDAARARSALLQRVRQLS